MEVKLGFKQTDVGIIPVEWEVKPLSSLTKDIGDGIHATPEYVNASDYYFINGNNLLNGRIIISEDTMCVSDKEHRKLRKSLDSSTILMSINGTIGNLAYYKNEKVVLGKSAAYINVNQEIKKEFLYYMLQSHSLRTYYENELTGTTIHNLSLGAIRNTPTPLPPTLAEQEAIAEALSDADALIEALEQLITKKRQVKQGAMQELLTGKKRLAGFEKKYGYKKTEVGILPEDWDASNIGDVSKIFGRIGFRGYTINDIVKEGKGAITISPSNIQDNKTDFSNCTYISWKKYEESPEIKIENGDILLVKTGSTVGKTAIVKDLPERATINPQIVVLKKIRINNLFLGYSMEFKVIQQQLKATTVGGALPTLSQKQIAQFKFPLPSTAEEQTAIAEILSDMDAEVATLEEKLVKARNVKQGMMSELLTGRVRLV